MPVFALLSLISRNSPKVVLRRWIGATDFTSESAGTGLISLKRKRRAFENAYHSMSFNALRLRFRLVASDFPGIVCILDDDRSAAVQVVGYGVARNSECPRNPDFSCVPLGLLLPC